MLLVGTEKAGASERPLEGLMECMQVSSQAPARGQPPEPAEPSLRVPKGPSSPDLLNTFLSQCFYGD